MSKYENEQRGEVLVIDDEPSIAEALKMILEDSNYRVSIALTGRDGIEQARRGQFCLTITDLRLPDMTGFDIIDAICRDKPESLFILITSHGSEEVLAEAQNCGVAGFLLKPFPPSEILQLVASTLATRRASDAGASCLIALSAAATETPCCGSDTR
ncbi:MAG TPA: response regulator [Pyrinomonadaceae bacterium]|nr:response regulator [Pyrinomonadaceae bacterium]